MTTEREHNGHLLEKGQDKRWHCSRCKWDWASKPQSDCPKVPRYGYSYPSWLASEEDLAGLNLKPTCDRVGIVYYQRSNAWVPLYDREKTTIKDPDLPPIFTWQNKPKNYLTANQLRYNNLAVPENPDGVIWTWDREEKYHYWYPLYDSDRCEWQARDEFVTKTALKTKYLLSDGWIKKLGEPDTLKENPHCPNSHPMQLYSRQRVEKFLADNVDDYCNWLEERDRYVFNFELHCREKIKVKQKQQRKCLQCAYSSGTKKGFLCTVYPMGVQEIPCPDWTSRGISFENYLEETRSQQS